MDRNNIIFVTRQGDVNVEAWGSLTEICDTHDLPYHSLKNKKLPIEYDGWELRKIPYREKLIVKITIKLIKLEKLGRVDDPIDPVSGAGDDVHYGNMVVPPTKGENFLCYPISISSATNFLNIWMNFLNSSINSP